MTSKEKIVDIRYLIMEHYSDKQPLEDYQKASRNCFFRYCDEIKQDLERLEKLEKTINEVIIRNRATQIANCFLSNNDGEKEIVNIFNEVLKSINKTLEEAMGEHINLKEVLDNETS